MYATIHTPTPLPTAIQSTSNPNGTDYGGSGDIVDNVLLAGFIYDEDGKIVEKAKVSVEFIYLARDLYNVVTDTESDSKGFYAVDDFKDGTKVKITVSKEGYQDISRTETLKVNYYSNQYINFGGKGDDAKYALKKIKTP